MAGVVKAAIMAEAEIAVLEAVEDPEVEEEEKVRKVSLSVLVYYFFLMNRNAFRCHFFLKITEMKILSNM